MTRTSEAATTKTNRPKSKIATEFLNHQVCRCLGDAKETMCRYVDGHCLVDAMTCEWVVWGDLPAKITLDDRQPVWRIAIDFVRAAEDERRVGTMMTSCLKQRQCAVGINGKVHNRITSRPIMRWLCGGVNY